MKTDKDPLANVLAAWKPVEARASFETDVLRRVRLARPTRTTLWHDLAALFNLHPAFAQAALAVVAVTTGIFLSYSPARPAAGGGVLVPGSVSLHYAQLVTGGAR